MIFSVEIFCKKQYFAIILHYQYLMLRFGNRMWASEYEVFHPEIILPEVEAESQEPDVNSISIT